MRVVTVLLCLVLVLVLLNSPVEARGKKRKKKKKRGRSPLPAPSVEQVNHLQQNAQDVARQCEQRDAKHNELVKKHNHLVDEYNKLGAAYKELATKFNGLVDEVNDPSVTNLISSKFQKAVKHPGIEGAINKTHKYVLPVANHTLIHMQKLTFDYLNQTQSNVEGFLYKDVGLAGSGAASWVPSVSTFLIDACIVVPVSIGVAGVLHYVCKLGQLLISNQWIVCLLCVSLCFFGVREDEDPLDALSERNYPVYQFMQVGFAVGYVLFTLLVCVAITVSNNEVQCLGRVIEVIIVLWIGIGYYFLVWTPAMLDQEPRISEWLAEVGKTSGFISDVEALPFVLMPYWLTALLFGGMSVFELWAEPDEENDKKKVAPGGDGESKAD